MTVSVQQQSHQQPGIEAGVRGQQPQLTHGGRVAQKAVSERRRKENNVDSSAASGEHTAFRLEGGGSKTVITLVLDDNRHKK